MLLMAKLAILQDDLSLVHCVCVWQTTPVGQIFGPVLAPNNAEMGQYTGFRLFLKVSTGFTWNLIYKLIRATFVGV